MIKSLLRFSLSFVLCCMFVYAPEILSSVSAPYNLVAPERSLLRIALHCSSDTSTLLDKLINAYQKQHPHVHLRITHMGSTLLSDAALPYPDVMVFPTGLLQQLPPAFSAEISFSLGSDDLVCALYTDSKSVSVAAEFAAYIYEALPAHKVPSEI